MVRHRRSALGLRVVPDLVASLGGAVEDKSVSAQSLNHLAISERGQFAHWDTVEIPTGIVTVAVRRARPVFQDRVFEKSMLAVGVVTRL